MKLPYIYDKKLFLAVMGACSYVKATGWFNKACAYYADKYDVDEDEVCKYVHIASIKKGNSGYKFKYYVVAKMCSSCEGSDVGIVNYRIQKAKNKDNAAKEYKFIDTGSYYNTDYFDDVLYEFETRKEAEEKLAELQEKREKERKERKERFKKTVSKSDNKISSNKNEPHIINLSNGIELDFSGLFNIGKDK